MTERPIKERYQDESIARTYDRDRFASLAGRIFDRLEKRAIASLVGRACHDLTRPVVLDIPCGTGRITEFLLDRGFTVTGADISAAMIDVARERCAHFGSRVTWRRLDLDALELADQSVDLVTCIRLFHHLESDARARILRELARVTRRFVIVNLSFSSPIYRARRHLKHALGQGVSKTSGSWTDISREATFAGLRVEASRFVWQLVSENLLLLLARQDDRGSNCYLRMRGSTLG